MRQEAIYAAIEAERERQRQKWSGAHEWGRGDCSSPDVPLTVKALVLGEECGEVQRAVLEKDRPQVRTELVQVAAVAIAWLEDEPDGETPDQLGLFAEPEDPDGGGLR